MEVFLFTNILGACIHRVLFTINIVSPYNVSDIGAGDMSYQPPLAVSQPSGRHQYGNQESRHTVCGL